MGLDVGEIGMGVDLSLDLKMFATRSLGRAAAKGDAAPAASAMDDCIRRLEEEKGKIEVFRRELPLCARLLADGENRNWKIEVFRRRTWAAIKWLHARQKAGGEPFQMYGPELTCMALDHVPMYDAEFVAGAPPARVTCRVGEVTGEGLVIVLPTAEGDAARDVVVTLPAEVTARICRDDEVLQYGAEVVAGVKVRAQAKTQ